MSIEFRELRSFIHVARVGSFSRAAAELFITQPALSRQIKKLEDEYGVILLIRHGRGVRLTAAGASLLERAETITHYIAQTADQLRSSASEGVLPITIGVPPALGLLITADVVEQYRSAFPNGRIAVREGLSSSLQEWLLDRRVDLIVVHNQVPLDGIDIRPVFSESMVLVGPAQDTKQITMKDLPRTPLIMPAPPHSNRRLVEIAATQSGVALNIALEVDSVPITKTMISKGMGYTILAYSAVHKEVQDGLLSARPLKRPAIRSTIAVATRNEHRAARHVQALKTIIVGCLRDMLNRQEWEGESMWLAEEY